MVFKFMFFVLVGVIIILIAFVVSALLGKPLNNLWNNIKGIYKEEVDTERVNEEKENKNYGKN